MLSVNLFFNEVKSVVRKLFRQILSEAYMCRVIDSALKCISLTLFKGARKSFHLILLAPIAWRHPHSIMSERPSMNVHSRKIMSTCNKSWALAPNY